MVQYGSLPWRLPRLSHLVATLRCQLLVHQNITSEQRTGLAVLPAEVCVCRHRSTECVCPEKYLSEMSRGRQTHFAETMRVQL